MRRRQAPRTCKLSGASQARRRGAQLEDVQVVGVSPGRRRIVADLGEQLAVDREVALAPNGVELLERLLELPASGAHQLVERPVELIEPILHLVERLVVLEPLLAELSDQGEDLIAGLLDHEVVERLTDDTEEANNVSGEHITTRCSSASSSRAGSCSWMNPVSCSLGRNSNT